ncbi:NAD/NADP octopine/nopaline dehydrogenase family protein [Peptostreptococcus faecalis]|uniref:NAD/NADP octopine/nopaline dehydrogenase family protein n=1 Tax=Peptostreptococcus faecalis TaxID=2045015 RepID=UPI000C7A4E3A|nr:NAD/NADP-dependent octopine/nopaline dehydrogenase family protein [Peptostreptococcus faecalis]
MKKVKNVTIIAAGNGGITAAADLKDRGFDVILYDLPEKSHKLETIIENNGILLRYNGEEKFVSGVECSTDIDHAVRNADIIMFTIPGLLVEKYAEVVAPAVSEDQLIYFNNAASMSGIRFKNKAKEMNINHDFFIAESNSLTYATRADAKKGHVDLSLKVKETLIAALPKEKTNTAYELVSQIYDGIIPVEDIWRITLENANPEVHPGPCLLNAVRIENHGDQFSLYRDGFSKNSSNLLKAIAKERRAIASAFGYKLEDIIESRINRGYFADDKKDIHLMFRESPVFSNIDGPSSIKSRYVVEDIENGLVLWSDLGRVAEVPTPAIDSVITLGSIITELDFKKIGLTLKKLKLDHLNLSELKSFV